MSLLVGKEDPYRITEKVFTWKTKKEMNCRETICEGGKLMELVWH